MTVKLTLEELKAENAAEVEELEAKPVETKQDASKDEFVEVDEANAEVKAEVKADEEEGEAKADTEAWMQSEEATHEDDQKPGFVPNHEAADRRRKAKALKGELTEAHDENTELKARIAALEAGKQPTQEPSTQLPPRPTREQFEYDDDKYDAAVDDWNDKKLDAKLSTHYQTSQQESEQNRLQAQQQETVKKGLDDHYERAASLVADGKVSEENYRNADKMVRLSLDQLNPGKGDALTDAVISTLNSLGAGSEKVMYQLGVNTGTMQELKNKLQQDPSGNLASVYLGQLQAKIQNPSKRSSQAPAPGKAVDGEGGSNGPAGSLQKAYDKSTDPNARVDMKRKAKKAGHDVSKW